MDKPIPSRSTLAIIGAGPIGLEAAAWAVARGCDVAVFEKAGVGHHIRQWGHVRLFSPFSMNHSRWSRELIAKTFSVVVLPSESEYLTGSEYVERYLEPLSRVPAVSRRIFTGAEVRHVAREGLAKKDWIGHSRRLQYPFRIFLEVNGKEIIHRAEAVIDASGIYSSPQHLGSGNIPAPGERQARRLAGSRLHYGLPDILGKRKRYAGKKVILVGGGHSAATVLESFLQLLSEAGDTHLFWVNRSPEREPYPLFENDPLPYRDYLNRLGNRLAVDPPSWLTYFGGASVEEIARWPDGTQGSFKVVIHRQGDFHTVEADDIIASVGFMPDNSLYRQLQVHECYATAGPIKLAAALLGGSGDCLAQKSQGLDTLKNPEPNFFILGNKSYGTNPTFLLKHGIEQVETVMQYLSEIFEPETCL